MDYKEVIQEFRTLRATSLYDDPLSDNQEEVLLDFWFSKLKTQSQDFKRVVEEEADKWKGDGLMGRRGEHYQNLKLLILKAIDNLNKP